MLRAVGTVLSGSLIAQLLGFAVLPLLTRLYAPEDFGALQFYQSILSVLLVMATMRYEIALLRASTEHELKSLLLLCSATNITISAIITVCFIIITVLWPSSIIANLPFPTWLIPLSFVISGFSQFVTFWITRNHAFSQSAHSKVALSAGYSSVAVSIGTTAPGPAGMVLADIVGKLVSLAWLSRWICKNIPTTVEPVTLTHIKRTAKTYREFPLVSVPGGIINAIGGIVTPVMIYTTFSASISGHYALVERSLVLPLALLVAAVSQVYTAEMADNLRNHSNLARRTFHKYLRLLALAAIVPVLVLYALAPVLFTAFFGAEWSQAGIFAQSMAPAFLLMLMSGGTNMTLMLVGMQKTQMSWEIGRLAVVVTFWSYARKNGWDAERVVMGYGAVVTLSSIAFLAIADIALRRRTLGGPGTLANGLEESLPRNTNS